MMLFRVTLKYCSPYERRQWEAGKSEWYRTHAEPYPDERPMKVVECYVVVGAEFGTAPSENASKIAAAKVIGSTDDARLADYEALVTKVEYVDWALVAEER